MIRKFLFPKISSDIIQMLNCKLNKAMNFQIMFIFLRVSIQKKVQKYVVQVKRGDNRVIGGRLFICYNKINSPYTHTHP